MALDYKKLEEDFDCSCQDVIKSLTEQYKSTYRGGGPEKLMTFFDLIQKEFEAAKAKFILENSINGDGDALKSVNAIAKSYAKKCIDDYSKA
jgi:hypothetical protein